MQHKSDAKVCSSAFSEVDRSQHRSDALDYRQLQHVRDRMAVQVEAGKHYTACNCRRLHVDLMRKPL